MKKAGEHFFSDIRPMEFGDHWLRDESNGRL